MTSLFSVLQIVYVMFSIQTFGPFDGDDVDDETLYTFNSDDEFLKCFRLTVKAYECLRVSLLTMCIQWDNRVTGSVVR